MIRDELASKLQAAVKKLYNIDLTSVEVAEAQGGFGDYSSNVAFGLSKQLKQIPRDIAAALATEIEHPAVQTAEAAGAGFVNFTLTNEYWQKQLTAVGPDFARLTIGAGQKVQVEYISANPTGPTTIANARGGFIGEVLSRVLNQAGYEVTREYYFNNAGTQISKLLESVKWQLVSFPRPMNGSTAEPILTNWRLNFEWSLLPNLTLN